MALARARQRRRPVVLEVAGGEQDERDRDDRPRCGGVDEPVDGGVDERFGQLDEARRRPAAPGRRRAAGR
jgi:hypothetical protein